MDGVGSGHQPINLAPTPHDSKTREANKSEGCFGRFNVTVSKTIKEFLSSILSSKPRDISIQARYTQPHNPIQQPGPDIEDNSSVKAAAKENFEQALFRARDNPVAQERFADVCDTLEQMQACKNDLRNLIRGTDDFRMCSLEIQLAKADYKEAVKNFNNAVSTDLKIDASELEMAMANKHSPEFADHYASYEQMKSTLL